MESKEERLTERQLSDLQWAKDFMTAYERKVKNSSFVRKFREYFLKHEEILKSRGLDRE